MNPIGPSMSGPPIGIEVIATPSPWNVDSGMAERISFAAATVFSRSSGGHSRLTEV
jgi:hypothetical protein